MTTTTIHISSNVIGDTYMQREIILSDATEVIIDLYGVESRDNPPLFLNIEWGDGSDPTIIGCDFTANQFNSDSINAATQVQNVQLFDVLVRKYSHIYTPSTTSLTKQLSCYISVEHINTNDVTRFIIPFKIITPSFYNKIQDMRILQTNIIQNNKVLFTIGTEKDSSILETSLDMTTLY